MKLANLANCGTKGVPSAALPPPSCPSEAKKDASLRGLSAGTPPVNPSCRPGFGEDSFSAAPIASASVRVHPVAYTEVSIFPIRRDFAAVHADGFPAHSPGVHASDDGHVNERAVPTELQPSRTTDAPAASSAAAGTFDAPDSGL